MRVKLWGPIVVLLVAALLYWRTRSHDEKPASAAPPVAVADDSDHAGATNTPPPVEHPAGKAAAPPPTKRDLASGTVVVKGTWGSQPGQFARRADPESNPEAPMALAVGPNGEVLIVDQVNRRVQRFKNGKPVGTISMGGDTVQDLSIGAEGRVALLDRLVDKDVQVYGPDGKLLNEVPITGKGVPEGGSVTGVFSEDDGIWVERDHQALVHIADANGNSTPDREELPGRLTRDGKQVITASVADGSTGQVLVRAFDRASGQPAWQQQVQLSAPVQHILMLDSDRQGMVYLAADVGHESTDPPFRLVDETVEVVRLGAGGTPRGTLDLPPYQTADEQFRPITVDDSGAIYEMVPSAEGLAVTRYVFP